MIKRRRIDVNNVRVDIWERFEDHIFEKYGKIRGVIGYELEKAILIYLNSEKAKAKNIAARTHTRTEKAKTKEKIDEVVEELKSCGAWESDVLPMTVVDRLVKEYFGFDPRTREKYRKEIYTIWENEKTENIR